MRPLVSVVTPTWQRPELLAETIENVREQDYPEIEHAVISDGPDGVAEDIVERAVEQYDADRIERLGIAGLASEPFVPVELQMLGRNWSGIMPTSFGIAPLTVGYLMARGEYVMNWSDDDRALTASHITGLVDLLESSGADFVYPKVRIWRVGDPDGPETGIIGTDPPRYGQITHMLFRASCLWRFGMPRWGTHPVDWFLVQDWIVRGATWAMLDECTFSHRLDQP